jgi:glycosyltransferase involved in cell wall biosynthesis
MDDADRLPFISVVVPVLNGAETVGACLTSLERQDYPASRREIIVVDNGSSDQTAEIVRAHEVRYMVEPQRGTSRARNRGIEACEGEIVAFTDADCLPSTSWLRELVGVFGDSGIGAVAGEIVPFPPKTAAERYAGRIRHLAPERYLRRPLFPFAVTANLAVRSDVFDLIGLLDPASPRGGESTDFCTRLLRQTDLRLELAPLAVVFHRHRSSAVALFRQQFGYGRGHAYLYDKYRESIPWGWRETVSVYRDLGQAAAALAAAGLRCAGRPDRKEELEFHFFEFVRKLGLRLGFAREALGRGRFSL